jgi:hypothetical protein
VIFKRQCARREGSISEPRSKRRALLGKSAVRFFGRSARGRNSIRGEIALALPRLILAGARYVKKI